LKNSISSSYFSKIYNNSRSVSYNQILFKIYNKKDDLSVPLLGFAINKKLGKAHERVLFKRRCRALFNRIFIKNNKKIAMIIIPKSINLDTKRICDSFELLKNNIS
tara:strand:+ start:65 stop:382 length:318 start_codon:yes stop_codon:yes gene_type:complete